LRIPAPGSPIPSRSSAISTNRTSAAPIISIRQTAGRPRAARRDPGPPS
jgi:hypothetical protein